MFPKVDALPGAEHHRAGGDRDAEVDAGQRRADVGRHVVVALVVVLVNRVGIRGQARKNRLEVGAHGGVGVFLDEQRGGGVADVQCGQAGLEAAGRHQAVHLAGDLVKPAAARGDAQLLGVLPEHGVTFRCRGFFPARRSWRGRRRAPCRSETWPRR